MNNTKDNENKDRVIVIGFDGITPDLVYPWASEGKLPNLARFFKEGSWGELQSTLPVNSAPAWVSFATGNNPGKHGIYHFTELGNHTSVNHFHNGRSRKSLAIWNILSQQEADAIIINVPFTYPPENIKGIMISGLDAPGTDHIITHPENILPEVNSIVGKYEIEADLADLYQTNSDRDRREFLRAIVEVERKRSKAALHLMKKYEWQLAVIVFMATDRVQHRFWKFMDKNHPHYSPADAEKFGDAIFRVYQEMDKILGTYLEEFKDATFIIMSDHGSGPGGVKYIDLNRWLCSIGLLKYLEKKNVRFWTGISAKTLSFARETLRKNLPVKLRHYIRNRLSSLNEKLDRFVRLSDIDWSSTLAYSDRTVDTVSTIWINLKGREPDGVVEEGKEYEELLENIIEKLHNLKDASTNEQILDKIYRREDIYSGPHISRSPDLIIKWKNDAFRTQSCIASRNNNSMNFIGNISSEETSMTASGEHKEEGIFLIKGKNIFNGKRILGARIIDIAPTLLYSLNYTIPEDVDGRVLTDVFKEEYLKAHPIREKTMEYQAEKSDDSLYTAEDERKIEERLKSLGYLE